MALQFYTAIQTEIDTTVHLALPKLPYILYLFPAPLFTACLKIKVEGLLNHGTDDITTSRYRYGGLFIFISINASL